MKTLWKDIFRSIKKSKGRFFSIMGLMALGSFALVGLKVTGPDMRNTAKKYYQEQKLMDIAVIGDMGIDDENIKLINKTKDAEIEYGYFKDVLEEKKDKAIRIYSMTDDISNYYLDSGAFPKNKNEIALDENYKGVYKLGDDVKVEESEDEFGKKVLKSDSYKLVGFVSSPEIISSANMGQSTAGNGSLLGYGLVTNDAFDSEVYMVARIRYDDLKNLDPYSDTYTKKMTAHKEELRESLKGEEKNRLSRVKDEMNGEINDGETKINNAKKKLSDTENQLNDAKNQLAEGQLEIIDGQNELSQKLSSANAQISSGENEINKAKEEITENEEKLSDANKLLKSAKATIDEKTKQINSAKTALEDGKKSLESGKGQLENAQKSLLASKNELSNNYESLSKKQEELNASKLKLDEADKELSDKESLYKDKKKEFDQNESALNEKMAPLDKKKEEFDKSEKEYLKAKNDLENKKQSLEDSISQKEKELTELNKEFVENPSDSLREEIDEKSEALNIEKNSYDSFINGIYKDTSKELSQKNEKLGEVKKQIDAAYLEFKPYTEKLEKARIELKTSREKLDNSKKELENKKSEYEKSALILQSSKESLDKASKLLESKEEELNEKKGEYESSKVLYEKNLKTYKESLALFESGLKEYNEKSSEYQTGLLALNSGKSLLAEKENELNLAKDEMNKQEAEANQKLDDARNELSEKQKEYDDKKSEFDEKKPDAEKEISKNEDKLSDAKKLEDNLTLDGYSVFNRREIPGSEGYTVYENVSYIVDSLSEVFPIFLYFVAALVTLTTMTRFVDEERINAGTLKALGYDDKDVRKKFIFYGVVSSIAGSIVGIILGHTLIPMIVYNAYYKSIDLPKIELSFYPVVTLISLGLALLSAVVPAILVTNGELKEKPAGLLLPKSPAKGSKLLLEKVGFIWNRLSFTHKLTARNLFRYKKRMFMTIFGVAGSVSILFAGLSVKDSIEGINARQFGDIINYDMIVAENSYVNDEDRSEIDKLLDSNKVSSYEKINYEVLHKQAGDKDNNQEIKLIVPNKGENLDDYIKLINRKTEKKISLDNDGVVISEKLADLLNVKAGDTIKLYDANDNEISVKVSDITEMYMGHFAFMNEKAYTKVFGKEFVANANLVNIKNDSNKNVDKIAREFMEIPSIKSVAQNERMISQVNLVVDALNKIMMVLIIVASLLGIVILFNLTTINVSERLREISTIKVLGFYDHEVSMYIYRETIILTFLGILAGFVIGNFLHLFIIKAVSVDELMFNPKIYISSYIIPAIVIGLVTLALYFVINRRLKNIDMLEALKSVD